MKTKWQTKTLGEVCTIKPPKKEARDRLDESDMVSFVPMEDLGILAKDFIPKKERPLKDVSGSYTYFSNDDVLLAKITPCFENGKIGIARNLKNGVGFGSSEYMVFRSKGEIIPDYLYYFLSREQFREEGEKQMMGAVGHKRVSKDFIENYEIPFPVDIPTQHSIVKHLDETFAAIAKAKAIAEKNLQNAHELFEANLENVFANPDKDWKEKELGDICEVEYGYTERAKNKGKHRFVRITDTDENGLLTKGNKMYIDSFDGADKYILNDGDLLMARTGASAGNVLLFEGHEDAVFASYLIRIKFKKEVLSKLYWYFSKSKFYWDQVRQLSAGSAQPQFNGGALKQIVLSYPSPLPTQHSIVDRLTALSTQTKTLESIYKQKLAALEELKKSILQKAFSGEL